MLLLKAYLNAPASRDDLRLYQRDSWGRERDGKTCVIELSAVAAKAAHTPVDRMQFRDERVGFIRAKIHDHKPKLVVMYGKSEKRRWQEIAEAQLEFERPNIAGATMFVMTPHPNTRGRTDSDWVSLGARLRALENPLPESTSPIARPSEPI